MFTPDEITMMEVAIGSHIMDLNNVLTDAEVYGYDSSVTMDAEKELAEYEALHRKVWALTKEAD